MSRSVGPALVALLLLIALVQPAAAQANFTCDETEGRFCINGVCPAPNSDCVCDAMWSSKTDFVNFPNDCATSFIGMYVLWGLNVFVLAYAYFKSLGVILIRIEVFLETRRARRGYGFRQNKGLLAVLIYFFLCTPFHLIMSIANLVDPELRVGFELLPSICFFFAKCFFYTAAGTVQANMLAITLKGENAQRSIVKGNYAFQVIVNLILVFLGALPFFVYSGQQNNMLAQMQIMQAYYLLQAFGLFCSGIAPFFIMRKIKIALSRGRELLDSAAMNRSLEIERKVNDSQLAVAKQSIIQALVYLLLGAIPFFLNKHKYFLPISWLAMPLLGIKIAHQFVADENAKSVMQRLGLKKTGNSQTGPTSNNNNNNNNMVSSSQQQGAAGVLVSNNPLAVSVVHSPSNAVHKLKSAASSSAMSASDALLEDMLNPEHELHDKFAAFIRERHAENEFALLRAVTQYKLAGGDSKERKRLGGKIVNDFILPGAPRQVDLPSEQRDIILSTFKRSQFVNTTFDELRRTLKFDLKGNFLAAFDNRMERERACKVEPQL